MSIGMACLNGEGIQSCYNDGCATRRKGLLCIQDDATFVAACSSSSRDGRNHEANSLVSWNQSQDRTENIAMLAAYCHADDILSGMPMESLFWLCPSTLPWVSKHAERAVNVLVIIK